MGQLGTVIQQLSGPSFGYAEGLLKDIPAERFARHATPGGEPITANHPAWQIGHLAIYPAKVAEACGLSLDGVANSEQDLELFDAGSPCNDDVDGSTTKLFDGYRKLGDAAAAADDEFLAGEHQGSEGMRERFPTRAALLSFMVSGHMMMHLGQISTWRRCEGMGSAF